MSSPLLLGGLFILITPTAKSEIWKGPRICYYSVDEFGPARVKELAESFKLDISTLSRQAAALEAKELIQRLSDPSDGRVSLFAITKLGRQRLKADKKMRLDRYERMLDDWSGDEKEMFGRLLPRLNEAFID